MKPSAWSLILVAVCGAAVLFWLTADWWFALFDAIVALPGRIAAAFAFGLSVFVPIFTAAAVGAVAGALSALVGVWFLICPVAVAALAAAYNFGVLGYWWVSLLAALAVGTSVGRKSSVRGCVSAGAVAKTVLVREHWRSPPRC